MELLEGVAGNNGKAKAGLNIVVVGGGATGVETAGALADILQRATAHLYPNLDIEKATVTLVDRGKHLLEPFTEKSQAYAAEVLQERGVILRMGSSVAAITESGVSLSDGEFLSASLVSGRVGCRRQHCLRL